MTLRTQYDEAARASRVARETEAAHQWQDIYRRAAGRSFLAKKDGCYCLACGVKMAADGACSVGCSGGM